MQVLVKVGAAGVNPVDTYIRSGNRASLPSLPYTPGADAAGTVEGIGPNVKKYKVSMITFNKFNYRHFLGFCLT